MINAKETNQNDLKVGDTIKAYKGIIKGDKFIITDINKVKKGIDYIDAISTDGKLRIYYPKSSFKKIK